MINKKYVVFSLINFNPNFLIFKSQPEKQQQTQLAFIVHIICNFYYVIVTLPQSFSKLFHLTKKLCSGLIFLLLLFAYYLPLAGYLAWLADQNPTRNSVVQS